jgi:simple sugar transport system ATP-binding protein
LKESGISVIFISHKIDEIIELCDTVIVLRDGKLIASKQVKDTNLEEIETLMVGQALVYSKMETVDEKAPVVLEVGSLAKKNNFKDITFDLRRGEILGIIGLLGSGRTELALSLFGMSPADSGTIAVDGTERHIRTVMDAVQAGIAYVPEDRLTEGLVMNYPINENIVLAALDKFKDKFSFLNRITINETAKKWLQTLSIKTDSPANLVSSLSGGNQQKVVLAKWLERDPKILILDGPTVGIDIGAKAGIFAILKTMIAEKGVGIILISDEIKEIVAYSHRVMIMRNGRVARILRKNEISEDYIYSTLNEQKQTK